MACHRQEKFSKLENTVRPVQNRPNRSKAKNISGRGQTIRYFIIDEVKKYIENFEEAIEKSQTRAEAMETMKNLYPNHEKGDFLLLNSVHASMPE